MKDWFFEMHGDFKFVHGNVFGHPIFDNGVKAKLSILYYSEYTDCYVATDHVGNKILLEKVEQHFNGSEK